MNFHIRHAFTPGQGSEINAEPALIVPRSTTDVELCGNRLVANHQPFVLRRLPLAENRCGHEADPTRDVVVTRSRVGEPVPGMKIPLDIPIDRTVLMYFELGPMEVRHAETMWVSPGFDDVVVNSAPIDSPSAPFGRTALWIGIMPAGRRQLKSLVRTQAGSEVKMGVKGGLPRRLVVIEFSSHNDL